MTIQKHPVEHDTLVVRLSHILFKLNQGDALEPHALAEEFGVHVRTIQRDLNQRFAYMPLKREDGTYRMDPAFLGRLTSRDIQRFASLAGVNGLFPDLSDRFLREIFDTRLQSAIEVRGHHYEDLRGMGPVFKSIEQAVVNHHGLRFDYVKGDGQHRHVPLAFPYRLVNQKGIWYLIAEVAGCLKTYAFSRLSAVWTLTDITFPPKASVERELQDNDSIWLGESRTDVVIEVSALVAPYFKRRKLIANQVIAQEWPDGRLIVSARVAHADQVLPIVRYWIPHLRITSPAAWQRELEQGLQRYLPGGLPPTL
jgi:predicted DNA-binding transcriptional regulator YafY